MAITAIAIAGCDSGPRATPTGDCGVDCRMDGAPRDASGPRPDAGRACRPGGRWELTYSDDHSDSGVPVSETFVLVVRFSEARGSYLVGREGADRGFCPCGPESIRLHESSCTFRLQLHHSAISNVCRAESSAIGMTIHGDEAFGTLLKTAYETDCSPVGPAREFHFTGQRR